MSSPRAGLARLALMLATAAGPAVVSACGSSGSPAAGPGPSAMSAQSATSAPAATTTSTTSAPAPTTTTVDAGSTPSAPQPSGEQAAAAFMNGWMAGDRARAASVATPAAVSALFAHAYAGQPLNDRGCSDAFPPIDCTWGPYAGGSGSIYQVQVTQGAGGWYVSDVTIDS